MWTTRHQFAARLKTYPEGFIVAECEGKVGGIITSLRTVRKWIVDELPSWQTITDRGTIAGTHDPAGNCLFLMAVNVSFEMQGLALGNRLVNAEISLAAGLRGVESVLGYTRIPQYERFASVPLEQYVAKKGADGLPLDKVLRFHVRNGAEILTAVRAGRAEDAESLGHAVLICYDEKLRKLRQELRNDA